MHNKYFLKCIFEKNAKYYLFIPQLRLVEKDTMRFSAAHKIILQNCLLHYSIFFKSYYIKKYFPIYDSDLFRKKYKYI